jgi:ATP-binding cassette subfamily C (CFTR/MRP) protein 1
MNVASSVVLKELLRFATDSHRWHNATDLERESLKRPRSVGAGFGLAVGLVVMLQTIIVLNGVHGFNAMLGGSLLRTGVIDQVSRKSMRLSTRARVKQTNGRITTAITGDAAFIDNGAYALIDVIVEPIAILAGFALLLYNLRVSALVGIGVLLASSPILAALFNKLVGSRQAQMALIDKRVRLLSEVYQADQNLRLRGVLRRENHPDPGEGA